MEPDEILEHTRRLIAEHAGDDPDKWWYANRYVFARLQLDERKTKRDIKQRLLDSGVSCHQCGQPFETRKGIHFHRLDGDQGYRDGNCALMHPQCHRDYHAAHPAEARTGATYEGMIRKVSKRYDDKAFLYWWDIAPSLAESFDDVDSVEFVKRDTKEYCSVPVEALPGFLTPERQTSRGDGNWGIRVLAERPDALAFEPGSGSDGGDWRFLPVSWTTRE